MSPSVRLIDSRSVRTSHHIDSSEKGIDGGKKVKGRKEHIIVDMLRLPMAIKVHAAKSCVVIHPNVWMYHNTWFGSMNFDSHRQSKHINNNMLFSAFNFLATIDTLFTAIYVMGRPYTSGIYESNAGTHGFTKGFSDWFILIWRRDWFLIKRAVTRVNLVFLVCISFSLFSTSCYSIFCRNIYFLLAGCPVKAVKKQLIMD